MKKIIGSINSRIKLLRPFYGFSWKRVMSRSLELNILQRNNNIKNYFEDEKYIIYISGNIFHKYLKNPDYIKLIIDNLGKEEEILNDFEGHFSIIIWDKKEEKLTIANDKLGLYPMYIYKQGEELFFSSDMDFLIMQSKFEINHDALAEFFNYGYTLSNKTLLKDIINLEPGAILKFQKGEYKIQKYFSFEVKKIRDKPDEYYIEKLNKAIEDSIVRRVTSDEIMMDLSGGLDTRLILAYLLKHPVNITATTTYTKSEYERDLVYSKEIAKAYNIKQIIRKDNLILYTHFSGIKMDFFDKKFLINIEKTSFKQPFNKEQKINYYSDDSIFSGRFGSEVLVHMLNKDLTDLNRRLDYSMYFSDDFVDKITVEPHKTLKRLVNGLDIDNKHKLSYLFITQCLRNYIFSYNAFNRPDKSFIGDAQIYPFLDCDVLQAVFSAPEKLFDKSSIYFSLFQKVNQPLLKFPWTYDPMFRPECMIKHKEENKISEAEQSLNKIKEALRRTYKKRAIRSLKRLSIYKNLDLIEHRPQEIIFFDKWISQFKDNILLK